MSQPTFTFLTWNLCMLEASAQAPNTWRMDIAEARIREFVLELEPDFVFFQELPGIVPFVETHDLIPANTTSHCGNIATIAKKELMEDLESRAIGTFGVLTASRSAMLTFANVHLEPGKTGDWKRLQMVSQIKEACPTPALMIVGDTNTRIAEEEMLETMGIVGDRPPKATWNSRENLFRQNGREYTAYYTRYFHNENVRVDQIKVHDNPLEMEGKRFYMSDHYAMSGRVTVLNKGQESSS